VFSRVNHLIRQKPKWELSSCSVKSKLNERELNRRKCRRGILDLRIKGLPTIAPVWEVL